jgi:ABC-2 type transport system permease protein
MSSTTTSSSKTRAPFNRRRAWVVCRTGLRQLLHARDFWVPIVVMGAIFYVILPVLLLGSLRIIGSSASVNKIAESVNALPQQARDAIPKFKPNGTAISAAAQAAYALAVYLFASLAVVVPVTVGNAVGSSAIVGERERGTGEFLAHSPASTAEIYIGKLVSSFLPAYVSTLAGFGLYSVVVNTIVGPQIGRIFFPTPTWLVLMFWVIPGFIAFTLSIVLRVSGRVTSSTAAHQISGIVSLPAILLSYSLSSTSLGTTVVNTVLVGLLIWVGAGLSLYRGMRRLPRWRLLGVAIES